MECERQTQTYMHAYTHTNTHVALHTHTRSSTHTQTHPPTHSSMHTHTNYTNLQPSCVLLLASTNQPLPTNPHTHKITLHLTCDPSSVLWGWHWQWCHSPARRNRYGSVSESRSHAARLQQSDNRQPEWSWPPWKSWPGPILSCCRWKTNMYAQGLDGGDSSVVRVPDSWLKGRGFESLLARRENFPLQGRLSVLTLYFGIRSTPPCYRSST